jgi:hypothetical protein
MTKIKLNSSLSPLVNGEEDLHEEFIDKMPCFSSSSSSSSDSYKERPRSVGSLKATSPTSRSLLMNKRTVRSLSIGVPSNRGNETNVRADHFKQSKPDSTCNQKNAGNLTSVNSRIESNNIRDSIVQRQRQRNSSLFEFTESLNKKHLLYNLLFGKSTKRAQSTHSADSVIPSPVSFRGLTSTISAPQPLQQQQLQQLQTGQIAIRNTKSLIKSHKQQQRHNLHTLPRYSHSSSPRLGTFNQTSSSHQQKPSVTKKSSAKQQKRYSYQPGLFTYD